MKTLIQNGRILAFDQEGWKILHRDIAVEGSRIRQICFPGEAKGPFDKIVDASAALVMPGLINAHTHAYMSLFRNYADDLEFFDWLEKVQHVEDQTTVQMGYWGSMLSIVEMIRTGTTTFTDMHMYSSVHDAVTGPDSAVAGAVNDSGIRAFLSRGMVGESRATGDAGTLRRFTEFFHEMELFQGHERITFLLGPHAPYSCGETLLREIREEGLARHMRATIHIAESEAEVAGIAQSHAGKTPVQYVADSGLFDLPVIAAHCVQMTEADIRLLQEQKVSIAINPRSNMKLGNGFAPVEEFLKAGINVCLGTDGSGSNNTQNMFQEMNFAGLVYKGAARKAKCVDAGEILQFATINGAKALGMEGQLGILAEGALADIILLDLQVPQFMPQNNPVSALVYSANGSEVKTVMVHGNILMEDRKLLTIDESRVYEECNAITRSLGMTFSAD